MSWEGRTDSRRDTWKESSCLKIDTNRECTVTKNSDTTGENVSQEILVLQSGSATHYVKFYVSLGLSFPTGEMRGLS